MVCASADEPGKSQGQQQAQVDSQSTPSGELSFRERAFRNYENRIRQMSSPEKVFEYFASVRDGRRLLMTPQDFLAALVPNGEGPAKVPSTTTGSTEKITKEQALQQGDQAVSATGRRLFNMVDANKDGLLDFTEYMFLTTMLSIPLHDFVIAFKMFDLNRDGAVDRNEFVNAIASIRNRNPQARVQVRDQEQVVPPSVLQALFGDDGGKKIGFQVLHDYVDALHKAVLQLEFEMYDREATGYITPVQFALALVSQCPPRDYSVFSDKVLELEKGHKLSVSSPSRCHRPARRTFPFFSFFFWGGRTSWGEEGTPWEFVVTFGEP